MRIAYNMDPMTDLLILEEKSLLISISDYRLILPALLETWILNY